MVSELYLLGLLCDRVCTNLPLSIDKHSNLHHNILIFEEEPDVEAAEFIRVVGTGYNNKLPRAHCQARDHLSTVDKMATRLHLAVRLKVFLGQRQFLLLIQLNTEGCYIIHIKQVLYSCIYPRIRMFTNRFSSLKIVGSKYRGCTLYTQGSAKCLNWTINQ